MDRKGLATMSNAGVLVDDKRGRLCLQHFGSRHCVTIWQTLSLKPCLNHHASGVCGKQTLLTNFDKTLSLTVTSLTRFPKGMIPTGLSGSWPQLIWSPIS